MTDETEKLLRRGLWLEYATLVWNVAGVAILLFAAAKANSIALTGFGLDSLIEIGASSVVIWQLKGTGQGREGRSLRLIATAFFGLASYIFIQSAWALWSHQHAAISSLGMAWLVVTFTVMVALAQGKRMVGTKLNNPVLIGESRVTMVDAYLAAAVLAGVALNAMFGWWWADPAGGLVIVFYGIKEGRHAWQEGKNYRSDQSEKQN